MTANNNGIRTEDIIEEEEDEITNDDVSTLQKKTPSAKTALIIILSFVNFCYGVNFSLHGPLLPKLAREKGLQPWLYSLVFGAFYLIFLVFIPVGIIILQRVPNKIVLFTGAFVVGSCALLFGTLQWCQSGVKFIALAICVRMVEGFGAASLRVSSYAIAASNFSSEIWKFSMWIEFSFSLGFIIGPIAGVALYDVCGFSIPFYSSGVLSLIAAVCAISVLSKTEETDLMMTWNFSSLFLYPSNLIFICCTFATAFYTGFLQVLLEVFLGQFHLSGVMLGFFFSIPVIARTTTAIFWKWLSENGFNGILVTFMCSLLLAVSILLIGPTCFIHLDTSLGLVIGALILKGLGEGGQILCSFTLMFHDVIVKGYSKDVSTHCMLLELFACCMTLGSFLGSSLSGIIYETLAFKKGSLILLALELLPLPFLLTYAFRRNYRKYEPFASSEETTSILPRSAHS